MPALTEKYVNRLYSISMGLLMDKEAKTHGKFFTQKEFEKNKAIIYEIKYNTDNLKKLL